MFMTEKVVAKKIAKPLNKRRSFKLETTLLLMVLPFVAFIIIFNYAQLLGWLIAFEDYNPGVSIFKAEFVGLKYFFNLFTISDDFGEVLRNTFALSFLGILCTPLPAILAIMINELRGRTYKRIVQTITSLPNFMSWVIIYAISFSFFAVDDGLINNFLFKLHLISEPTNMLGNPDITWYFQTALNIWKTIGWNAIIYIGAIAGIEHELYEAAHVDGAGRLKQILYITIPGIMPTFVVLLFLAVGAMLSGTSFEQIYVFHNGLVHDKLQTLDYYIYSVGIRNFNFSLATAAGVFKTLVSVVLLFIAGLISKKAIGRSIL